MKSRLMMIGSALIASLLCLPALAQPGPGMGGGMMNDGQTGMAAGQGRGMGPHSGPRARGPRDCAQSPNPAACTAHREARAKAIEACKGTAAGPERQRCMHAQRQNFDCAQSANPQQCEHRKTAYKACEGQTGPAFRQCVQQKMPPLDCSKSANPARCDQHQKVREACKDKLGPDHKACLREQFGVK